MPRPIPTSAPTDKPFEPPVVDGDEEEDDAVPVVLAPCAPAEDELLDEVVVVLDAEELELVLVLEVEEAEELEVDVALELDVVEAFVGFKVVGGVKPGSQEMLSPVALGRTA